MLDGLDSAAFTRRTCGVSSGAIQGFARIAASPSFSSTFTTAGVESPYNCSGQAVEARRASSGLYEVRFNGNAAGWALAGTLSLGNYFEAALGANVVFDSAAGVHRVQTFQTNNLASDDKPFVILLF